MNMSQAREFKLKRALKDISKRSALVVRQRKRLDEKKAVESAQFPKP